MRYMVIERFRNDSAAIVFARAREHGRQLPTGLSYVDSWVTESFDRCFQIMETEDPALFEPWVAAWSDFVDFEIVPVMASAQAASHFATET